MHSAFSALCRVIMVTNRGRPDLSTPVASQRDTVNPRGKMDTSARPYGEGRIWISGVGGGGDAFRQR